MNFLLLLQRLRARRRNCPVPGWFALRNADVFGLFLFGFGADDCALIQGRAHRVESHSRILQQATRLCARRGFARTRTIDVARAAGVSHGSVFVHFPSRADLMTAVVAEMAREITDALHALSTAGASVGEVLTAHVECLAAREHQIRWLLLETPMLPKGFHTAWLGLQSAVSVHLLALSSGRWPPVESGRCRFTCCSIRGSA